MCVTCNEKIYSILSCHSAGDSSNGENHFFGCDDADAAPGVAGAGCTHGYRTTAASQSVRRYGYVQSWRGAVSPRVDARPLGTRRCSADFCWRGQRLRCVGVRPSCCSSADGPGPRASCSSAHLCQRPRGCLNILSCSAESPARAPSARARVFHAEWHALFRGARGDRPAAAMTEASLSP